MESLRNEIKIAQQNYDLEKAAELQYGKLPQLEKELEQEEELIKNKDMSLVHESVTEEEISRIISRWTGIPVAKLMKVREIKPCIWIRNFIRELWDRMRASPRWQRQLYVPKQAKRIQESQLLPNSY